ncbi:HRAS-like suppressor 3 [Lingula anatina]|uniref:HRAS-like suppressor 3 n=1 Tax=Lingula anatina TaxID=7574 RepID=A0A1S3HT02_LINAN|nr:HRAS-like suppressor 3 [Lingula anatina]|eukprot:XP_013389165.1 HRAS-like suppressor 3 [Lingula anatina]
MAVVRRHNQTVLDSLEPGDMIEFHRPMYCHWAVYIGDEQVVHITGENDGIKDGKGDPGKFCSPCGVQLKKAFVLISPFWDVAGESKAVKNNGKDRKHRPARCDEIVERALSKLGDYGYNVLWKNCEHFASWCRYGVEWSEQADIFWQGAAVCLTGAAVVAGAGYVYHKQKNKKENKT